MGQGIAHAAVGAAAAAAARRGRRGWQRRRGRRGRRRRRATEPFAHRGHQSGCCSTVAPAQISAASRLDSRPHLDRPSPPSWDGCDATRTSPRSAPPPRTRRFQGLSPRRRPAGPQSSGGRRRTSRRASSCSWCARCPGHFRDVSRPPSRLPRPPPCALWWAKRCADPISPPPSFGRGSHARHAADSSRHTDTPARHDTRRLSSAGSSPLALAPPRAASRRGATAQREPARGTPALAARSDASHSLLRTAAGLACLAARRAKRWPSCGWRSARAAPLRGSRGSRGKPRCARPTASARPSGGGTRQRLQSDTSASRCVAR